MFLECCFAAKVHLGVGIQMFDLVPHAGEKSFGRYPGKGALQEVIDRGENGGLGCRLNDVKQIMGRDS